MSVFRVLIAISMLLTLSACGTTETFPGNGSPYESTSTGPTYQPGYGVVETVSIVEAPEHGIGAGAVAGGVVGAIVGSQFGSGTGRAAATVAGTGVGAYAGHQIERRARSRGEAYQLTLRMDNGVVQNVIQDNRSFQVGDRVQVTNDGRVILL